jgi:hypothetical protein
MNGLQNLKPIAEPRTELSAKKRTMRRRENRPVDDVVEFFKR